MEDSPIRDVSRRTWLGVVLVALLLAASMIYSCAHDDGPDRVSAAELEKALDEHTDRTLAYFGQRAFVVDGRISHLPISDEGKIGIMLQSEGILSIPVDLAADERIAPGSLVEGQAVSLRCGGLERTFQKPDLKDCRLDRSPSED